MNRAPLICAALAAFALILTFVGGSFAEGGGDEELARDLTLQGISAQQRGDHQAALAYFDRAQRELEHAKISYFRAKSLDALARYSEALELFKSVAGDPDNVKYEAEARAYIRAIEAEALSARLLTKIRALEKACPTQGVEPVPVSPHSTKP